jgi:putative transposase
MESTGQPSILSGLREGLDYPLMFDPGERWEYGIGIDWLGQVVEKVDGRAIDDFCRDELFQPLGMQDGFVALRRWVRICIRSPVTNKMPKTKDAPRKPLPAGIGKVLKRLHYPLDVIVLCVRWYVAYSLSLRNLEEMMAERGIEVDHSSVHRWVIKLVPLFEKAFRRHKRPVGKSWRMDETYVKVKGQWKYLYRAVDKQGNTVDFLLRAHRDKAAARRYFEKAIDQHGEPETITVDKSGANLAALEALNAERLTPIKVRQNKYLNNIVEQDHRAIKRIIKPMMGFKDFRCARIILAGIELMHMIRKGQMHDDGFAKTAAEQFRSLVI